MTEFINRVSLTMNDDTAHRIHFVREGVLESMTLAELDRQAATVASRLRSRGVGRGDRVGVMSRNRIEWVLLDLAVLKLGGVVTGMDAGRYDAAAALQKYGLHHLFIDDGDGDNERILRIDTVTEWTEDPPLSTPAHDGYRPEDICAIRFTSGSTGPPKGLEISTGSIDDSLTSVQEMFAHGPGDNLLILHRLAVLQQRYWIYSALVNAHDVTLAPHEDALPIAQQTHPTVVMGVPVFYDETRRVLESSGADLSDLETRREAIQAVFGGAVRYLWTGSAPASCALLDFYNDCGVPLYQGYGLVETCIVAKNHPGAHRIGSVGKVLPNKTVRFDSDGLVIIGSRHPVTTRYSWCAPGDSEQTFLPSGEVRTRDLGYFDEDGFLYIRGRVDEIIVLGNGRNVLVPPLEQRIKTHPAVRECILVGMGEPFLTALVSPVNSAADAPSIQAFLDELNATLPADQRIHGLVVSEEPFTIENGMLSAQFKPLRKEIARRLGPQIAAVYAEELHSRRNFAVDA